MSTFNQWHLWCPKCEALPDEARLEICHVRLDLSNCPLQMDGYDLTEARVDEAEVERVYCHACEETFDLEDCHVEPVPWQLGPGDEVTWNDPDGVPCTYTIETISFQSPDLWGHEDCVITITTEEGAEFQCYAVELQ